MAEHSPWWRNAVFYEIYIRSFADSDGDGVGDLPGIRSRLPYIAQLGVDGIWLTPFYPSPQADHGYDVADYRDVEPLFGTLADLDGIVTDAHALGLKVTIDIVPNHTSSAHPWFQAALSAVAGSPERDRYIFRAGRGAGGSQPPNNWESIFGGPAWTRVSDPTSADGEWYLHFFDNEQPDLNWENTEVGDEFESILRFWLDRGVDGFRVDVAHGLVKLDGLPDSEVGVLMPHPAFDQPGVHEIYQRWRRILDEYPGDRMSVAEAWAENAERRAQYVRAGELHQAFNFDFQLNPWSASAFREVIEDNVALTGSVGAAPTWVLSSHDQPRHVTRYGGGSVGTARARAATLLMLALPGSSYLYCGEELGLPQVVVPESERQDPAWERSGHTEIGRDGCRVPIPWSGSSAPYGFGPGSGPTWLTQPAGWGALSVAAQDGVEGSTLELYRLALRLRREHLYESAAPLEWVNTASSEVLAITRGPLSCVTNFGDTSLEVGVGGEVLLTSGPEVVRSVGAAELTVPPNTTVWTLR